MPTSPPTISPSHSPTQPPTQAPTPNCPTITVTILNETTPFVSDYFNGLYTYSNKENNRVIWTVPQIPTDKLIHYVTDRWVIEGENTNDTLFYVSNELTPPTNATWKHSADPNLNI
eukprot:434202_1